MLKTFFKLISIGCFISLTAFGQTKSQDIFELARSGNVNSFISIIEKEPSVVNSIDPKGFSLLILACYNGNDEVAEYLIENSKDLNFLSPQGTALAACVFKNKIKWAHLLLSKGASPNIAGANGETPLILAIMTQNEEMVKLLLKYKTDKTLKDKFQKTAFLYALETQNYNIINLLKN
ncbi:MAG TPA: ankyrin repeat domain-containing protein [Edaphocola sp.]|nr:ankyrin repeat domain-containing protein [Edaphocola sp.]